MPPSLFTNTVTIRNLVAKSLWPSLYRLYMPLAFTHDLHQLESGKADVLVYDSNILRGLISGVAQGQIAPEVIADIYAQKVLPRVDKLLLAVVKTNPAESVKRWVARDGVQLPDTERNNAINERIDGQKAVDLVVNSLAKLPNVTVITLDGDKAPSDNAATVVAAAKQ